jgi:hypothetical protein
MTTRRALMAEADQRRAARVARKEGVPVTIELPDGTRFTFGASTAVSVARGNSFDDAL